MSLRLRDEKLPRQSQGQLLAILLAIAFCALLSGCAGDSSAPPDSSIRACEEGPDQQEKPRQTLTGDVTGDGRADTVSLVVAPRGKARCRYKVLVESGKARDVLVLHQAGLERSLWPESDLPRLEALAAIDERRGEEIVVAVGEGAATTAIAVVTSSNGAVRRMSIESTTGQLKDTLIYGASGGGVAIVDCVGGRQTGRVSELSASRSTEGSEWITLERKLFRVSRDRLELEQLDDEPKRTPSDLTLRAEKPFRSCASVRAQ